MYYSPQLRDPKFRAFALEVRDYITDEEDYTEESANGMCEDNAVLLHALWDSGAAVGDAGDAIITEDARRWPDAHVPV